MNLQAKVDDTSGIFNQAIDILSSSMKGEETDSLIIKSAITSLNGHIKLINAKKGEEALVLAKKRIDLDWASAVAENREELKKLLKSST